MKKILNKYDISEENIELFKSVFSGEEFFANGNEISAEVIKRLLTIPELKTQITHKGIIIKNTIINNELDLYGLKTDFPIYFENTIFNGNINLSLSKIESLIMIQCTINDSIYLTEAEINGQLNFKGSAIKGVKYAICAHNTIVTGHVYFCNIDKGKNFSCEGKLDLEDIKINGSLHFSNAFLKAHNSDKEENKDTALTFSSAKIAGNVWMDEKFIAEGEVKFIGANIGGDLKCSGGKFINPKGRAINADISEVNGNVFFDKDEYNDYTFKSYGEVKLSGAKIKGQLRCCNAKFEKPKTKPEDKEDSPRMAILAKGLNIDGPLFICNSKINGLIDLIDAKINGRLEIKDLNKNIKKNKCHLVLNCAFTRELKDNEDTWNNNNTIDIRNFTYNIISEINSDTNIDIRKSIEKRIKNGFFPKGELFTYQPYLQMAEVIEKAGYSNESTWLRIKMNDIKMESNIKFSKKVWLWFLKVLLGYGYKPIRVIYWAIGIWLLGAILFSYGYNKEQIKPPSKFAWEDTEYQEYYTYYPKFDPLIYSLDVFLPIVNLGQQDFWKPISNHLITYKWFRCAGSLLLLFVYLEILLGWFLTSMLIAGITGLIKQK